MLKKNTVATVLFITLFTLGFSENSPKKLGDIAGNISGFKNQQLTLTLRLKNIDINYMTITFYDSENIDITFNFDKKLKKRLREDFLNAHRGLQYHVTFVVEKLGDMGLVHGKLLKFKPVVMDKIYL